jgi:hypothetical protein
MIELTQDQCRTLREGEPVRLAAPEIGEEIVVLRATAYDALRADAADKREQDAILSYSKRQAAQAGRENPY